MVTGENPTAHFRFEGKGEDEIEISPDVGIPAELEPRVRFGPDLLCDELGFRLLFQLFLDDTRDDVASGWSDPPLPELEPVLYGPTNRSPTGSSSASGKTRRGPRLAARTWEVLMLRS